MNFLKKMIAATLVTLLLISALPTQANAADSGGIKTGVAFVNTASLRLRSSPSTSSTILGYATENEVVVLMGRSGNWYRVLYNLQEGYSRVQASPPRNIKSIPYFS